VPKGDTVTVKGLCTGNQPVEPANGPGGDATVLACQTVKKN
jgi:hypothetical protein